MGYKHSYVLRECNCIMCDFIKGLSFILGTYGSLFFIKFNFDFYILNDSKYFLI